MLPSLIVLVVFVSAFVIWLIRRRSSRMRQIEVHSITPEALHALLASVAKPDILDVRVPLDFLAYSEIIPGACRISPQDIVANSSTIPKDGDYVLYCTCPGDKSSLKVLRRALGLGFPRVKILKGGLAGWKSKGYPVEVFDTPFHLERQ